MRSSYQEKWFYAFNYGILSIIAATCFFPLLHMFALSFSDADAVRSGRVIVWPVGWNLKNYNLLFEVASIGRGLVNSAVITVVGVVLSMIFTILCAYPLSRPYFVGRRFFTLYIVFTMIFSGGMIPTYLLLKSLHLINSYGAIWLPSLISAYNMLVMKSYFENVPNEIDEASRIDGCSEWGVLLRIVLPLSMPVIATLCLFYGVGMWNAFMSVIVYMTDTSKYNLTVIVQQMIQNQSAMKELNVADRLDTNPPVGEAIQAAGVIVLVLPMLVMYPFVQKYFVKGVMLGAVKG